MVSTLSAFIRHEEVVHTQTMPIPLPLHEVHHRGVDKLFPWMYGGADAASRL